MGEKRGILKPNGFSLIELVIVIVIMGIISAIAIPRLSRGARTAGGSALKSNLATMRNAIEMYAAEHDGKYPGSKIKDQLTKYSNLTGSTTNATKTVTEVYGPYLKEIPPMPVGSKKNATAVYVTTNAADVPPQGVATDGWWYNSTTLEIRGNLPAGDVDDDAKAYNGY